MAPADSTLAFKPDLAHDNPVLHELLYGRRMLDFYHQLLGGPVRHYDYTRMRAVAPGRGTAPHGDVVFMGRGTHQVYTAWVPLGDIDFRQGGLIVLEGSHPAGPRSSTTTAIVTSTPTVRTLTARMK